MSIQVPKSIMQQIEKDSIVDATIRQVWYNAANDELYDYGHIMHKALLTHLVMNPDQRQELLHLGEL